MTGQKSESPTREHIWLVALYEQEARADELLNRLNAIGIDTSEATTVRVEIDDQMRSAKYTKMPNSSTLSPVSRSAVTGALISGTVFMLAGIAVYSLDLFTLQGIEGLFNHVILFVIVGSILGAVLGAILASVKQRKIAKAQLPDIQQLRSEGFLVAVKMPPFLAEQAEEIARRLGAKEILL